MSLVYQCQWNNFRSDGLHTQGEVSPSFLKPRAEKTVVKEEGKKEKNLRLHRRGGEAEVSWRREAVYRYGTGRSTWRRRRPEEGLVLLVVDGGLVGGGGRRESSRRQFGG